MSTPETIVDTDVDDTDLDAFNTLFHGKGEAPKDDGPKEDDPAEDEDVDAPIEQEETQEDDEDDADLGEEEKDNDEEEEASKPKTRAEKRIEQLLEKARLAEERVRALEAEIKARKEPEAPKPTPKPVDDKIPKPDDKNEDGTDKYPLGQFDEAFQEDRFNYLMEKSLAEQKAALEQQAREQEARQAQEALNNAWNEKLNPARERYPDFQEKGEELLETFSGLDQEYGEYLTATIMGMEYGPDVLYFLSNNLNEAQRIVKLGPQGATIALGRIEAQFALDQDEEKPKPRPKVSKAPAPPPRNKGSNAALPEVSDDTDDLEAFSKKLFKKG